MRATRTALAWFTLVSIPAFFYALAWSTTPARKWNLWRELAIEFGSFFLGAFLTALASWAMVWAFKQVIYGGEEGSQP